MATIKPSSQVTTLDESPAASAPAAVADAGTIKGENHDRNLSGDHVNLTIHVSGEEGGQDAVFIGHNGYGYQVPRGKPWRVPREVAQIISDAVVTVYKPRADGSVSESQVPRFAYSIS